MKMYNERLATMCQWFDQWSESGQAVALIKMLTRVPPTQARFLANALETSLAECAELAMREQEANNSGKGHLRVIDVFKRLVWVRLELLMCLNNLTSPLGNFWQ